MTPYSDTDLDQGWEFKILRSATFAFRHPRVLQQVCEEEAKAGWVLVEKFDNQRLRFKRRATDRERDVGLTVDPYRSHYGTSDSTIAFMILGACTFVALFVFAIAQMNGR